MTFASCSQDNDSLVEENSFDVDEYISYLIGEKGVEKIGGPAAPTIETESDIISWDKGCYTVNVRVYITNGDGTRYLVAIDDVRLGDCKEKSLTNNTHCEGQLPDGSRVFENGTYGRICLFELLTKSDVVYNLYLVEIQQYQ